VDVASQSLLGLLTQEENEQACAVSEAYVPESAVEIIRKNYPEMFDSTDPSATQRAVYKGDEKMIAVEGISKMLYDLAGDPTEQRPYQDAKRIEALSKVLDAYLDLAMAHSSGSSPRKISLKDELIQQRLRDLGYME
jgi:hypothetical protein